MENSENLYFILFGAVFLAVTQASLDRAGVGRSEDLGNDVKSLIINLISIPLNLLASLGVIVVCVWSLFRLQWIPVVAITAVVMVGWGWILGGLVYRFRRGESWESLVAVGIPLLIVLKLLTSGAVIFLFLAYVK